MFDIGWQEIFVIAVLALIVIGPKDLPRALKTVTGVLRKMKGMARDFQSGLDDIVRESDLMDMKKQIESEVDGDLRKEIENSIDPDGAISKDLQDMGDFENDMKSAAQRHADSVAAHEPEEQNTAEITAPVPTETKVPEPAPATQTASDSAKKE